MLRTGGETWLRTRFPAGSGCRPHCLRPLCKQTLARCTQAGPRQLFAVTCCPGPLRPLLIGTRAAGSQIPKHPSDACVAYFKLFFPPQNKGKTISFLEEISKCLCTCKYISKSKLLSCLDAVRGAAGQLGPSSSPSSRDFAPCRVPHAPGDVRRWRAAGWAVESLSEQSAELRLVTRVCCSSHCFLAKSFLKLCREPS